MDKNPMSIMYKITLVDNILSLYLWIEEYANFGITTKEYYFMAEPLASEYEMQNSIGSDMIVYVTIIGEAIAQDGHLADVNFNHEKEIFYVRELN